MIDAVQFLSAVAIWSALLLWCIGMACGWLGKATFRWRVSALVAFLAHVICAFGAFYEWSFSVAVAETARLTEEVTGFRSGVGLWVNFAFLGFLVADLRWDCGRWRDGIVIFMIVNGAVIFADGPVRWFGIVLLVGLAVVACGARFSNRKQS